MVAEGLSSQFLAMMTRSDLIAEGETVRLGEIWCFIGGESGQILLLRTDHVIVLGQDKCCASSEVLLFLLAEYIASCNC
jgi:hypothetical protein